MRTLKAAQAFLIQQRYDDYTFDQHRLWGELVRRRRAQLDGLACREYWEGYRAIGLSEDCLPVWFAKTPADRGINNLAAGVSPAVLV